jgi:molecular chaperone DnaK (HSP70)
MCGIFALFKRKRPIEPAPAPWVERPPERPVERPVARPRPLSTSKFIIAIDFGTTYTGVAWGHFADSNSPEDLPNARTLADKIFVLRKWPGPSTASTEKTPSVISYATSPPTWGAKLEKVRSQHKPRISRFKLGLDPERVRHVFGQRNLVEGLVPSLNKTSVDVCADFLTLVNRYIETTALPDAFGEAFLEAQSKSYVITVPAIWSDRAKDLTRQAAGRAGIPLDKLILVTEPEAAALYSATTGEQLDLEINDTFIICDAGGGTVVCKTFLLPC